MPPRSYPAVWFRQGITVALLATLILASWGCDGFSPDRTLVSARFADHSLDGIPQEGESLILTFSGSIQLEGSALTGIKVLPRSSDLTVFQVKSGPLDHQLTVVIGAGDANFTAPGTYGESEDASGILLDLDAIRATDSSGKELSGLCGPVDIEITPPPPALLEGARWIDRDASATVSRGDEVALRWNRSVTPKDLTEGTESLVPEDLLLLPIDGDRLGSSEDPGVFLPGELPEELRIRLGGNPYLTIGEAYNASRPGYPGNPSGIAVNGTTIRPHQALVDSLGVGVASMGVVDIEGECDPFSPFPAPPGSTRLMGHSATALPDGSVLIAGGRHHRSGQGNSKVLAEAWLLDPIEQKWQGPLAMVESRSGHTATHLVGTDGIAGTSDDLVILIGGWNGSKALNNIEAMLPYSEEPAFHPVHLASLLSPRFDHSAHPLPGRNSVVLVGGRLDRDLNGLVEELELELRFVSGEPLINGYAQSVGEIDSPRREHASILIEEPGGLFLFIYGGYGGSLGNPHTPYTAEHCSVLSAPEVLRLSPGFGKVGHLSLETGADLPGIRRGCVLVPLGMEGEMLLLAGTAKEPVDNPLINSDLDDCRVAYKTRIWVVGTRARISYQEAGTLMSEVAAPGVAHLGEGRVLIVGGSEEGRSSAQAQAYDQFSARFEPLCTGLKAPRGEPTITTLADGRWLILGGTSLEEPGAEVFHSTGR